MIPIVNEFCILCKMSSYRKNTLVVDFSGLPKRPSLEKVEEFLKEFIELDMADVRNIQVHNLKNCVFIEMNDAGVAARLHKQHHLRHSFTHQGAIYNIPIYVDGPTTTVRILDLPPQLSNSVISNHLQQYGKVISVQNEVWKNFFPGVPNGVRVVQMRLEKPIPSCIVVENYSTLIRFPSDRSARGDKQQKLQTPSTSTNEQTKTDDILHTQHVAAKSPANQSSGSNASESDADNEHTDNGDDHPASTIEPGKRRLSSEADGKIENDSKRACNEGGPISDSEWKVHNTRSKRKSNKMKLSDVL